MWVSNEDAEIKEKSSKYNANIMDRPSEYAADDSGANEVIFHAINYLNLNDDDI